MPRKNLFVAVVLAILATAAFVAFGIPHGQSVVFNLTWSTQYADALSPINPLPRFLPGLWSGLGGYDFFFYAPLPFWFVAAVIDPLCPYCAPSTEFVLGSALLLLASGLSMYAFLRAFFAQGPATFGACVYMVLPYHLMFDWFIRQAAAEFTAYAFLPLVGLGIERLRRHEPGGWLLSAGVAGLLLSHLPTALLSAHVFGLLVLVFVTMQPGGPRARLGLFARFVWFAGLGLALASFYWLPAVALLDTVSPGPLFDPYFEPWRWLYMGAEPPPNAKLSVVVLIAFAACAPLLLGALYSARGPLLVWILVPAILVLFMNTAASAPIWREWILAKVQFPWRMLTLLDLSTAIAAAALAAQAATNRGGVILKCAALAALLPTVYMGGMSSMQFRAASAEDLHTSDAGAPEYLSPEMTGILLQRTGRPALYHRDHAFIIGEIAQIAEEFSQTTPTAEVVARSGREITVLPEPAVAVASLPVQFWFMWTAETTAGAPLEVRPNPTFGTLDIVAPEGGFDGNPVTVSLPFHVSEWAGGGLTVFALLGVVLTSRRDRLRRR